MVKFAPEGYPFIFGCLAVTALSVVLLPWGTPVFLAVLSSQSAKSWVRRTVIV